MSLQLTGLNYRRHYLGTYYAEVLLNRWYKGHPRGEFKYTYYRYHFDDANLYDELQSDKTTKKRMRALISFIRDNAQYIMRHNDTEYHLREQL